MELDNQPTSEDSSWPLPLPREVVAEALLPAAKESWRALRLACSMLQLLIDASIKQIRLTDKKTLHEMLPSLVAAIPRLQGLRSVTLLDATDAGLSDFAALALPRLTQLTHLEIWIRPASRILIVDGSFRAPLVAAAAPNGGRSLLAAHLSGLQALQSFRFQNPGETCWSPAAKRAVVSALAQLPALRDVAPGWGVCGTEMQRPCNELGAGAWRSLKALELSDIGADSVQALAPLTQLTRLAMYYVHCGWGHRLCSSISSAPWAPHLLELSIQVQGTINTGLLSGLQMPALTSLKLTGFFASVNPDEPLMVGWDLPKLRDLHLSAHILTPRVAASLADVPLPALTSLRVSGSPVAITCLLRCAPWLSQLCHLELISSHSDSDSGGDGDPAKVWRTLASAPLAALRTLSLTDCTAGYTFVSCAAAWGDASWLRGLQELELSQAFSCAAVLAALRAGSGGFAELEAAGRVTWLDDY